MHGGLPFSRLNGNPPVEKAEESSRKSGRILLTAFPACDIKINVKKKSETAVTGQL